MRAVKGFFLTLFILAVLGGAGFGVLAWRQGVNARSLDNIVVEPAPPQTPAQADSVPLDPRLEGLLPRQDGARLLWAPEPNEHLIAAGFSDNGSLIFSASATDAVATRWIIDSVEIASGTPQVIFDGADSRVVSGNHSEHRNAGKLCYSKPSASGVFDVWCSSLDGKSEKQLTGHDGQEDLISPTISPDGAWVVFEVNSDKLAKPAVAARGSRPAVPAKTIGSTIWKIGLNGAGIQQLTRGADDRHPSWSDDGKKIYFQRRMPDGNWDVYSMEADGTEPTPILRTTDIDELFPVRRAATDDFLLSETSASGTPRLKLLDSVTKAGRYPTGPGFGPETWPSVSPDGKIASFMAPTDPSKPDSLGIWLVQLDR